MKSIFTGLILLIISYEYSFSITKKAIKTSELPAAITSNISVRFPSSLIIEAYKVNDKGIISFEVIIKIKNERDILSYDVNGKFLHKIISAPQKTQSLPIKKHR